MDQKIYKSTLLVGAEMVRFEGPTAAVWDPDKGLVWIGLTEIPGLLEKLAELRDLARSGSKPDIFLYTEEEWLFHKINGIAAELNHILEGL